MDSTHSQQSHVTRDAETVNPAAPELAIQVRRLRLDELDEAFALTREQLSASVAADDHVRKVLAHNPESFWGIYRKDDTSPEGRLVGYLGFLLLNEKGAAALRGGTLDATRPDLALIAREHDRTEVIYMWSMVARRLARIAIPMIAKSMGTRYIGLPLCSTAATEAGLQALRAFGFTPMTEGKDGVGNGFWLDPTGHAGAPKPRRANPLNSRFKIVVASTTDEIEKAFAIRAAVFMIEQNCPYEEEFDGNDRTGTHMLGLVDGQPAATMRLRYFADFVKLERLAVLPRYRRTLIAREIVEAAINFCRRKGYTKVYGHAQKRLLHFWARFGFKPIDKNYNLVFSDHEYVELWGELEPHANPITMYSNPNLFLRPEGRWDEPCILEKSATRAATNPH
jgi:predicted GNAT family N-acyltransferase